MYPVGHLVVGYLAYSGTMRLTERRAPADGPVLALAVGTQFPDLIDKPLAWWLGVLPGSRTLAHSVYVTIAVLCVVGLLTQNIDREAEGLAFGFGYVSHLLADALYPFLQADGGNFLFLAWPLTSPVTYVSQWDTMAYLRAVASGPALGVELLLAALVFVIWFGDGMPGLAPIRRTGARWRERIVGG